MEIEICGICILEAAVILGLLNCPISHKVAANMNRKCLVFRLENVTLKLLLIGYKDFSPG